MIRDHHEWKTFVHGSQHACCPRPFLVAVRSTATTRTAAFDPRHRNVLRRDCRRRRRRRRHRVVVGRRVAIRPPRALRRGCAGDRIAAAPRARRAGDPRGARGRVGGARRHRAHRRHAGPGPRRRAARRALGREGPRVGGRHPTRPRRPSPGPCRDALSRTRTARAALHVPASERRPHAGPVGA